MFLYNLKIDGNKLVKLIFIIIFILILIIFSISCFYIFFKPDEPTISNIITLTDTIHTNDIFEITTDNYTDILQTVTNDIDSYIGCKIHFTGYIYRLLDFNDNQFVLARDMLINEQHNQSLVVGFLCVSDSSKQFEDNSWVDVTGTIEKGDYYGDIAQIKVTQIFQCNEPTNKYVSTPHDTYIPTSNMF